MTAPEPRSGGLDANARGILILVVAVAVGALLLWKADDGGTATATRVDTVTEGPSAPNTTADLGSDTTSTSTIAPVSTTSAPKSQAHQPGEVSVIVLNGGGPVGAAAATTNQIKSKGYMAGPAGNANAKVDTTVIYYADGYDQDAAAVAALLGREAGAAQPKPSSALGKGAESSNVVVVLGKDAPPVSGASGSTSTTAAGSTTSGTG